MATSFNSMMHKLQRAINEKYGQRILINQQQWYSNDQDRPVTFWVLKKVVWDSTANRNRYIELFSSTSQIQMVLFLRDYWYELNGWEVPTDNEVWNKAKEKYYAKRDE